MFIEVNKVIFFSGQRPQGIITRRTRAMAMMVADFIDNSFEKFRCV
jgi:hypothetical protein